MTEMKGGVKTTKMSNWKVYLMLCLITIGFAVITYQIFLLEVDEEEIYIQNISECQNLTFFKQVECIRDYIAPSYKYVIRDDKIRSFEDVAMNGGDCFDWSHVYKRLAIELGLNARVDAIYGDKPGHSYAVIWDKNLTGFCIVSSLELNCMQAAT